MSLNPGMMSSNRDDWETPDDLFDRLDATFHFQLDAAASATNKKCDRFFDETNSAFDRPWTPGPVWLNPPYSRGVIDRFISRAWYESERSGATVICLVAARTETEWFKSIWDHARVIIFWGKRVPFVGAPNSAPFPSAIAIFSPEPVLARYPGLLGRSISELGHFVPLELYRDALTSMGLESWSPNLALNFPLRGKITDKTVDR